jgi:hypothetical protein
LVRAIEAEPASYRIAEETRDEVAALVAVNTDAALLDRGDASMVGWWYLVLGFAATCRG